MPKTLFDQPDALAARLEDAAATVSRRVATGMIANELATRDQQIAELRTRIERLERFIAAIVAAGAAQ